MSTHCSNVLSWERFGNVNKFKSIKIVTFTSVSIINAYMKKYLSSKVVEIKPTDTALAKRPILKELNYVIMKACNAVPYGGDAPAWQQSMKGIRSVTDLIRANKSCHHNLC